MTVLKAMIILSDDAGKGTAIYKMDVIEHEGKNWLVPEWRDYKDAQLTMPVRIVCLDLIPHKRTMSKDHQFLVDGPVPKSVFEGRCPLELEDQYLVIENPDIKLPIQTVH